MFGHPALRLLFWLKLRAALRAQKRKLRRPANWVFLIVGVLLAAAWIASLVFARDLSAHDPAAGAARDPALLCFGVELGILVLLALTLVGAFQHRGLYLPADEIERLFSAPIARAQLVRYRLATTLVRSLFAALLFGALAARRLEHAGFAFAGTVLVMLTIPVLGQAAALGLGASESRLGELARRVPLKLVSAVLGMAVGIGVVVLLVSPEASPLAFLADGSAVLAEQPLVRAVLAPLWPWSQAITASGWLEFLPAFAFGLGAWVLLHEGTARIRIDYRELSLATSADVARRIRAARRGGWSASKSQVMQAHAGRGAPWLFGRGGFGAIAWLETTSLWRRARGTVFLSILVLALLAIVSGAMGRIRPGSPVDDFDRPLLFGSILISALGTVYLCLGLRFDFRGRLEQMELVKAWPLPPARTFLATILPEVVFVSLLVAAAVLARAAWLGEFHPALVAIVLFQPLFVLTWVALDNAVFLHSPVRYVPGQESALQHIGRSLLLVFLRFLVLLVVLALAVAPALGAALVARAALGLTDAQAIAVGGGVAWLGLLAIDGGLVWVGGRMLARFDVARDRGA